ncbi:MAG: septum site-determining protein minD, TadZ-like protein [Bifidobacterium psychraerophilum]
MREARRPARRSPSRSPRRASVTRVPIARPPVKGHKASEVRTQCRIVVFVGVSGGLGLSTLAAMTAWTFTDMRMRCSIIDADFSGGGIDVLLGIEAESGMRFTDIKAPLGRLDGEALEHELLHWEGNGVLSVDPRKVRHPDWWEQQAALHALQEVNDIVVVDAGRGERIEEIALPQSAQIVVLAELSVLGLARAGVALSRGQLTASSGTALVIGVHPRALRARSERISVQDAQEYLGVPLIGEFSPIRRLGLSITQGFGIARIPKQYRYLLRSLTDALLAGEGASDDGPVAPLRQGTKAFDDRMTADPSPVDRQNSHPPDAAPGAGAADDAEDIHG